MTDLSRLEELLAKATSGPWEACEPGDYGDFDGDSRVICSADPDDMRRIAVVHWWQDHPETDANTALIVEAINALPSLIARIRELEGAEANIVDWLRSGFHDFREADANEIADAIERGDHHALSKQENPTHDL